MLLFPFVSHTETVAADPAQAFASTITASRLVLTVTDDHAGGPALAHLAEMAASSQCFLVVEELLREGGTDALADYLHQDGKSISIPFFNWEAEPLPAETFLAATPNDPRGSLWGLDQVFIGNYGPLLERVASQAQDPAAREDLMKRNFLARHPTAGEAKVLFRFGSNHMARGLSATHVPSLGNLVADLALSQGKTAFNLLVLCGPGTEAIDFLGKAATCELDLALKMPEVVNALDAADPTLFDLARWKGHPKQWSHLPPRHAGAAVGIRRVADRAERTTGRNALMEVIELPFPTGGG